MNALGWLTTLGVGGVATYACITYAAWPQLIFFWSAWAVMYYFAQRSKNNVD
jgi:hypothetical protein